MCVCVEEHVLSSVTMCGVCVHVCVVVSYDRWLMANISFGLSSVCVCVCLSEDVHVTVSHCGS